MTILTGDYLSRRRRLGISRWLTVTHATLTGLLTFVLLLCPQYMIYERIVPQPKAFIWAALGGIGAALLIVFIVGRWGVQRIRAATLIPLSLLLFFLLKTNGHLLDLNYSARPLSREIATAAPNIHTIAVQNVRRDLEYGLAFYRNEEIVHYTRAGAPYDLSVRIGVPDEEHLLVIPTRDASQLDTWLHGRVYQQLFLYEWQGLSVYRVYAKN